MRRLYRVIYFSEPDQKRRKSANGSIKNGGDEVKLYGSELIVYDKHNRCLLTDGDYELGLQEVQTNVRASPKKHSSWECITEIKEVIFNYRIHAFLLFFYSKCDFSYFNTKE